MFLQYHAEIHIYAPKVSKERIYADLEYLQQHRSNSCNSFKFAKSHSALIRKLVHVQYAAYEAVKKVYDAMYKPAFVFDGRNILDRKLLGSIGFKLHTIGK